MELLVLRIAVYLDQLHTVKQGTWDILCGICGCNKQNLRQVKRNFHIMIAKPHVLFSIKYFKQCGKGISLIIIADLINFIQKHERILHSCLPQACRNSSGHCTDIGFPMATNLCFIPDTSETDPYVSLIQRSGNTSRNRGFTGSRRPHQTKDGTFSLLRETPYRQEFQNTLLDLCQSIVLLFQNLSRLFDTFVINRSFIPRKL